MYFFSRYEKMPVPIKNLVSECSYNDMIIEMLFDIVNIEDFTKVLGIEQKIVQMFKLTQGVVGIAKDGNEFVCVFNIAFVDLPKTSLNPNKIRGSYYKNGELKTKEFTNGVDVVLWKNTSLCLPEFNISRFAYQLKEVDKSEGYLLQKSRCNPILEVEDDIKKNALLEVLNQTKDGFLNVFVNRHKSGNPLEKEISDSIINLNDVDNSQFMQYLSEYHDTLISRLCNMYGLCVNDNAKHVQQSEKEISGMESFSWVKPIDMLECAKKFCEDMKEVFGVELIATFGTIHEKRYEQFVNDCTRDNVVEEEDLTIDENVSRETIDENEAKEGVE